MKSRRRLSLSLLFVVAAISAAGCSKDDKSSSNDTEVASTESPTDESAAPDTAAADTSPAAAPDTAAAAADSEFCTVAAEAEAAGDKVDAAFAAGPAELEAAVTTALDLAKATVELAPAEIVDTMNVTIEFQERFVAVLEANGWDVVAAFATPEGQQLQADSSLAEPELQRVRDYLEANCGIEDDSQDDESAATPSLPAGEEGLRRFIQLYAVGASVDVTTEQEDCFISELSGKVEVEQLQLALTGEAPDDVKRDVGLAVVACGIEIKSNG